MAGDPYPTPPPAARFVGIDLGVSCAGSLEVGLADFAACEEL